MHKSFIGAVALLVGMTMAYPVANAAAQTKKKITVPAGTRILIRTIDPIDSSKQKTRLPFHGHSRNGLTSGRHCRGAQGYHRLGTSRAGFICRQDVRKFAAHPGADGHRH
jgi:hypothetical protein